MRPSIRGGREAEAAGGQDAVRAEDDGPGGPGGAGEGAAADAGAGSAADAGAGSAPGAGGAADETLAWILESLEEDKAIDPRTVRLPPEAAWAEGIVVASGTSERHLLSMAEGLHLRLKRRGVPSAPPEGLPGSGWVALDAGDWVVHLFRPERRELYDLEGLWGFA